MNKELHKDEKGQFTYILIFIAIFVTLLFCWAILFPILEAMIIGFAAGTESIKPTINLQVSQIRDVNLQLDINSAVNSQYDMQTTTLQIFSTLVTFGGIIIIIVVFIAWLLIGRRNVEAGGLGWKTNYSKNLPNKKKNTPGQQTKFYSK